MRVLLVEPNDLLARALVRWLGTRGHSATRAESHDHAMAIVLSTELPPDAVITSWGRDCGPDDSDALLLVGACRRRGIPVVVLSAHARMRGDVDWIEKPGLEALSVWVDSLRVARAS